MKYNVWDKGFKGKSKSLWDSPAWREHDRKRKEKIREQAKERKKTSVKGLTDNFHMPFTTGSYLKREAKKGKENLRHALKTESDPGKIRAMARIAKKSATVAQSLARNPNLTEKDMISMAAGNTASRNAILIRKDAPASVVKKCLRDPKTRNKALAHPSCPVSSLKVWRIGPFAFPQDHAKRQAILSNPNCPQSSLASAKIDRFDDAEIVASHPNASAEQLGEIAEKWKGNAGIMKALMKNPNCPPELRAKGMKSRSPDVVKLAARYASKDQLDVLKTKRDDGIRHALAGNKNITGDIERRLIKHGNTEVRAELARNEAISKEAQAKLAEAKEAEVRAALAHNKAVEEDLKGKLMASLDGVTLKFAPSHGSDIYSAGRSAGGGRCAICGRPISGKHGNLGDKCRRK